MGMGVAKANVVEEGAVGEARVPITPSPSPSPSSSPRPMAIDLSGFEFEVTIHRGMDWDNMRLHR
jgi:hypothetical protein